MKSFAVSKVFAQFMGFFLLVVSLQACSILRKQVDPKHEEVTESGFSFRFPMSGEWFPGKAGPGQYAVGKKPLEDGSTTLAVVRHGPIWTAAGKAMTSRELLDRFQKDIEEESRGGRVTKVKSKFSRKKHNGAECLFFDQIGLDHPPQGTMTVTNDGMVCLHPTKPYNFIWMAMTQRTPAGNPLEDLADDKKRFFDSLRFL